MWTVLILLFVAVTAGFVILLTRVSVGGEGEFWKKVDHLARLRHDAPFDVVFVGHSIPLCAIDPGVVGEASAGLKTYNASLSTLFFEAAQLWITRFVAPALRPRVVVLGLAGMEFNPHSTRKQFMEQYVRAQDVRTRFQLAGPLERARLLCTQPRLVKFLLRRLAGRAHEPLPPPQDRSVLGPLGDERKHNERTLFTTERLHEALRDGIFTSYEFSESEVDKFRDFVRGVRAVGSEVIVLKLITMPNAIDYYPQGDDDHAYAWRRIRTVLDELDITMIEVDPSPFDETCFADVMHMNGRGKGLYSQQVGVALAAHLGLEPSSR